MSLVGEGESWAAAVDDFAAIGWVSTAVCAAVAAPAPGVITAAAEGLGRLADTASANALAVK